MAQQSLYGNQFCIGIEHLGSHSMAQVMTGDLKSCLFGIILDAFLNPSDGEGKASAGAFLDEE